MTKLRSALACLAALTALTACGNDQNRLVDTDTIRDIFRRDAPKAASPQETAALVATALRFLKEPVMLAIVEDRKATAIMVPYGRNGRVETWTTEEFQTISFRDGVITATRGLGNDLMSADTAAVGRALRQGGGSVNRTWRTIDGANTVIETSRSCRITRSGAETLTLASGATMQAQRMTEDCGGGLVNLYWLNAEGTVIQSRQWLGNDLGYLTQQILRR